MSNTRLCTVVLAGLDGHVLQVEAHTTGGRAQLAIGGVAEHASREMRDRVRAAVVNSGYAWPDRPVTISLLPPASPPTPGSGLDLVVACAVLAVAGQLPTAGLQATAIVGELGLDGSVHPVRGVLAMVRTAARAGVASVIVPAGNAAEAALAPGVRVHATDSLHRLVAACHHRGQLLDPPARAPAASSEHVRQAVPPVDAIGRHAAEVAAAGGHHLAIVDRSRDNRTRLAGWLRAILPDLDEPAAAEVTSLHCLAGPPPVARLHRPPLQVPHRTVSLPELLGGGYPWAPRPGVVSLAHHGVLLLDQAPEFSPRALDALRQPVEQAQVLLRRGGYELRLPAQFQLVLAASPCPCAAAEAEACRCTPLMRRRWRDRIDAPVHDRVDISHEARPAGHDAGMDRPGIHRQQVAARVAVARQAARARWSGRLNAHIPGPVLRQRRWLPPAPVIAPLRRLLDTGTISARGYDAVLRLAWTACDLAGRTRPAEGDIEAACALRAGDIDHRSGQA